MNVFSLRYCCIIHNPGPKTSRWQILVPSCVYCVNYKIIASRCQILWLKCTKLDSGWGSNPDPATGAYSAPRDPLAGLRGPTSKGREEKERKGGGDGMEGGEDRGGEPGGEGRRGERSAGISSYLGTDLLVRSRLFATAISQNTWNVL